MTLSPAASPVAPPRPAGRPRRRRILVIALLVVLVAGAGWWCDQVLLEVVADAGAVVVVEGVDISYATPYQRGTQTTGPTATVVVGSP